MQDAFAPFRAEIFRRSICQIRDEPAVAMMFGETKVDKDGNVLDGEKDVGGFDVVVADVVRVQEVDPTQERVEPGLGFGLLDFDGDESREVFPRQPAKTCVSRGRTERVVETRRT